MGRAHVTKHLAKFKPRLKIVKTSVLHNGVQSAHVTIISDIHAAVWFEVYRTCWELHISKYPLPPWGLLLALALCYY